MDKLIDLLLGHLPVKQLHILSLVLIFLATIPNGFVFIYQHKPEFIIELDIFKLLILSSIITTPMLLLLGLLMHIFNKLLGKNSALYEILIISSILTLAMFGIVTLLYFPMSLTVVEHFKKILMVLLGSIFGMIVLSICELIFQRKNQ